ncbi:SCO family protein [Chitinophaga sp. Cy-1792]|uniref:SCO family protein n=1 Tax=Chitinophaga sp. Cy-1792 TaxID=2608339 RepID=UPI00142085EC|nr:SCO family protein [Chitinophaga sp. Cy-1792]NIG55821.1 SCO family protein [Chitinophaga sp. Cy-1792]
MDIRRSHMTGSWKVFLTVLIVVPLLVYGIVRVLEHKFGHLPVYAGNTIINSDEKTPAAMPAFNFRDQDSLPVTNAVMQDKIVVANYFFTSCPKVCPQMMEQLQRVQNATGDSVLILSFTVDPKRDTPQRLHAYSLQYDVLHPRWRLLTGDKKALYLFARKGLYITATDGDGGETDFIHSDRLVLLDKLQRIRGFYNGTAAREVDQLLSDIKKLQHEM